MAEFEGFHARFRHRKDKKDQLFEELYSESTFLLDNRALSVASSRNSVAGLDYIRKLTESHTFLYGRLLSFNDSLKRQDSV